MSGGHRLPPAGAPPPSSCQREMESARGLRSHKRARAWRGQAGGSAGRKGVREAHALQGAAPMWLFPHRAAHPVGFRLPHCRSPLPPLGGLALGTTTLSPGVVPLVSLLLSFYGRRRQGRKAAVGDEQTAARAVRGKPFPRSCGLVEWPCTGCVTAQPSRALATPFRKAAWLPAPLAEPPPAAAPAAAAPHRRQPRPLRLPRPLQPALPCAATCAPDPAPALRQPRRPLAVPGWQPEAAPEGAAADRQAAAPAPGAPLPPPRALPRNLGSSPRASSRRGRCQKAASGQRAPGDSGDRRGQRRRRAVE